MGVDLSDFGEQPVYRVDTKIKDKTKGLDKIILISDFQNIYKNKFTNVTPQFSAIKLNPSIKDNISIDSVFISDSNTVNCTLNVIVRNQGDAKKNVPVAIYNKSKLISKRSSSFEKNTYKKIEFKIKNQKELKGKITSNFSDAYPFDNTLFFTIKKDQKINVLSIGKNATIGAGSTITQDAPDDKLTLSRNKQSTISKWKRPQKK